MEQELNDVKDQIIKQEVDKDRLYFISEVEQFNQLFGKLNNYTPTIPSKFEFLFVEYSDLLPHFCHLLFDDFDHLLLCSCYHETLEVF
jgi:hypothetical protein